MIYLVGYVAGCVGKHVANKSFLRYSPRPFHVMTSPNENTFRVTDPWGKSTGHRWILLTQASDGELWIFLWSAPEQTVKQAIETPATSDAIALISTSL